MKKKQQQSQLITQSIYKEHPNKSTPKQGGEVIYFS